MNNKDEVLVNYAVEDEEIISSVMNTLKHN